MKMDAEQVNKSHEVARARNTKTETIARQIADPVWAMRTRPLKAAGEMTMFTQANTDGYTDQELAALNDEAETRIPEIMADYGISEEQEQAEKAFADEVARR
jgi:hypothetical protein